MHAHTHKMTDTIFSVHLHFVQMFLRVV